MSHIVKLAVLDDLRARGFDRSLAAGRGVLTSYHVACSQCDALVINGLPAHETSCPRATHDCAGCDAIITVRQRYCADCA